MAKNKTKQEEAFVDDLFGLIEEEKQAVREEICVVLVRMIMNILADLVNQENDDYTLPGIVNFVISDVRGDSYDSFYKELRSQPSPFIVWPILGEVTVDEVVELVTREIDNLPVEPASAEPEPAPVVVAPVEPASAEPEPAPVVVAPVVVASVVVASAEPEPAPVVVAPVVVASAEPEPASKPERAPQRKLKRDREVVWGVSPKTLIRIVVSILVFALMVLLIGAYMWVEGEQRRERMHNADQKAALEQQKAFLEALEKIGKQE